MPGPPPRLWLFAAVVLAGLVAAALWMSGAWPDRGPRTEAEQDAAVPDEIRTLLATVADGDDLEARAVAARALGQLPAQAALSVPVLVAALHETLVWSDGERGRPQVVRTLDPEAEVRLSDSADGLLVRRGHDWAAQALGELGPRAKAAVPDLVRAFRYDGKGVWYSSVVALGRIGPDAADAVPALVATIEHGPGGEAGEVIGLRELHRARQYYERRVRDAAVEALGRIGPAASAALPVLESLRAAGHAGAEQAIRRILEGPTR